MIDLLGPADHQHIGEEHCTLVFSQDGNGIDIINTVSYYQKCWTAICCICLL